MAFFHARKSSTIVLLVASASKIWVSGKIKDRPLMELPREFPGKLIGFADLHAAF
jgi:hypothetical protein